MFVLASCVNANPEAGALEGAANILDYLYVASFTACHVSTNANRECLGNLGISSVHDAANLLVVSIQTCVEGDQLSNLSLV
jgi:hypothetical protein